MISNNMKTTKEVRDQGFDKFYTKKEYAKRCIDKVFETYNENYFGLIVEPSAGNGSFLLQIPNENKIGLDIEPEHKDIIKQDFLTYIPKLNDNTKNKNILVIGNPPFGKVCSLAIKFFNHAAQWANVIAFIIPRTFRRTSVQNKLHSSFHLVYDEETDVKNCCFEPKMMVKCCFQIWEKKSIQRSPIVLKTQHDDWKFLSFGPKDKNGQPTPPEGADFAIRAYGGKCGEIKKDNLGTLRPKSWHWIKSNISITELISRFKKLDYSVSTDTARQNSIGRGELVKLYNQLNNQT